MRATFPSLVERQVRGGTHDKDGFVLSAHRVTSQGRQQTTSSSQLISQIGLPVRVSLPTPLVQQAPCSRKGRTAVSWPDNGNAYRATIHALACKALRIRHLRTRPYHPQTKTGKHVYQDWGGVRLDEQVTFDAFDDVTGEVRRGRIAPADRLGVRRFLSSFPAGQVDMALEATTGWRFIVEELVKAVGERTSGRAGRDG